MPSFVSIKRFILLYICALFFSTFSVQAGNFYWDADADPTGNSVNTGAGLGGNGTWDLTLVNWYEVEGSGNQEAAWNNFGTNNAIFIGTPGIVTLGTDVVVKSLTFASNGFILTNGIITLSTNGTGVIESTNATIHSQLAGDVGISKQGGGTLTLTASNSFSGPLNVTRGSITIANGFALGSPLDGTFIDNTNVAAGNGNILTLSGNITVNGEPLTLKSRLTGSHRTSLINAANTTNTWNGPVTLEGDNITAFNAGANSLLVVNGSMSGSCDTFLVRGSGNGSINGQINIGNTKFTKTDGGLWMLGASSNVFGFTTLAVGTLKLGANHALPSDVSISFGQGAGTSAGTLDLAGFNQQVGGLSSVRSNNLQIIGNSSTVSDSMLTFKGSSNSFFPGVIKDVIGTGTRKVALTMDGSSLTLTNTNTYSGGTIINAGTLFVGTTNGSGVGTGTVTVNASGTLAGSGIIGGAVASIGNISPGSNHVGRLTLANGLNVDDGGTLHWDLATLNDDSAGTAGADFDQILLTGGNLNLGANSKISLNFIDSASAPNTTDAFWQSNHTWTIARLTGSATNSTASNFGTVLNGSYPAGNFTTAASGTNVVLKYTVAGSSQPAFSSLSVNAGSLTLNFTNSMEGASYEVQFKTNLNDANWTVLTNVVAGAGTTSVSSPMTDAQRFFRVVRP